MGVDWVIQQDGSGFFRLDLGTSITVPVDRRDHEGLIGALRRVTNQVAEIPWRHDQAAAEVDKLGDELVRVRTRIGTPFTHADELRDARRTLAQLHGVLAERYAPPADAPPAGPPVGRAPEPLAQVVRLDHVRRLVDAGPGHRTPAATPTHPVAPIPISRARPGPDHDLER